MVKLYLWGKWNLLPKIKILYLSLCLIIFSNANSESYVKAIRELSIYNQELIGEINIRLLNKNDVLYGISRYQRKAIKKGDKIYLITI